MEFRNAYQKGDYISPAFVGLDTRTYLEVIEVMIHGGAPYLSGSPFWAILPTKTKTARRRERTATPWAAYKEAATKEWALRDSSAE